VPDKCIAPFRSGRDGELSLNSIYATRQIDLTTLYYPVQYTSRFWMLRSLTRARLSLECQEVGEGFRMILEGECS
jgi:hypothetical protein